MVYSVNRYYDPATAVFLSVDPIVGSTNQPYNYAREDPVNAYDPDGTLTVLQTHNARIIYTLGLKAKVTKRQARVLLEIADAESHLCQPPWLVNKSSGASGCFQLLSSNYVKKANALGGVLNTRANTCAILPDYVTYFHGHPFANADQAGFAVERPGSGTPSNFYSHHPDVLPRTVRTIAVAACPA